MKLGMMRRRRVRGLRHIALYTRDSIHDVTDNARLSSLLNFFGSYRRLLRETPCIEPSFKNRVSELSGTTQLAYKLIRGVIRTTICGIQRSHNDLWSGIVGNHGTW